MQVTNLDRNLDFTDCNFIAFDSFYWLVSGYGSVLNLDGNVEMDASIMEGKTLKAGCCTLVEDIHHPISLARLVMEKTIHRFLGGKGVMKFAREQNVEILSPPGQLVTDYAREALDKFKQRMESGHDVTNAPTEIGKRDEGGVGTVGAIAIDRLGNVAAATSTGGITGKLPGRIGGTPMLGAGTYADNVRISLFFRCLLFSLIHLFHCCPHTTVKWHRLDDRLR